MKKFMTMLVLAFVFIGSFHAVRIGNKTMYMSYGKGGRVFYFVHAPMQKPYITPAIRK